MKQEIPKTIFGIEVSGAIERALAEQNPKNKIPEGENSTQSKIINFNDYWRIEGVDYNQKTGIYELSKELIPSATQEELAQLSKLSRENGGFYAGDARLHYAIFKAIKQAGNTEIRDFVREKLRSSYPNTLTRVRYQPSGNDEVIHNYKQKDESSFTGRVIGPDREINEEDKECLEILLGAKDIKEIKEVSGFINGTRTYIWRVNSIPKNLDERVVRFDAYSDWLSLYCYRDPSDQFPAFGVREVL